MPGRDDLETVESPADLEGTGLERRPVMRRLAAGVGTLVLGTSLAGCAGGGGSGGGDDTSGPEELVIGRAGGPDTLHPHKTTMGYSSSTMELIFDPLVVQDFDGNYHPGVGKGWEISDDGKTWMIEIQDNVTFHDGSDLTVDDVVYTYNKLIDSIQGWAVGPMTGVEKVDETTAQFNFETPHAPWKLYSSYSGYYGVLPKNLVEEDPEAFGSEPVGSGPYQMEEWAQQDHLTLTQNEEWNTPTYPEVTAENPPRPQKITFQVIPESTPRLQALLAGDIDMMVQDIPRSKVGQIESDSNTVLKQPLSYWAGYVQFNQAYPPMDNINLRRALGHAVDKERIIEDIYQGLGQKNWTQISETIPGWAGEAVREEVGNVYDPERAKQLLEGEGWTQSGGDFRQKNGETLELEMYAPSAPERERRTAEELVSMYRNIGVSINLTTFESTTAYAEFRKGPETAHIMPQTLGWFDPDVLTFAWHSDNSGASNDSRTEDPQVDEMLEEGSKTIEQEERAQIYRDLQVYVYENVVPNQPFMSMVEPYAFKNKIKNFYRHDQTSQNIFYDVQFEG